MSRENPDPIIRKPPGYLNMEPAWRAGWAAGQELIESLAAALKGDDAIYIPVVSSHDKSEAQYTFGLVDYLHSSIRQGDNALAGWHWNIVPEEDDGMGKSIILYREVSNES